MSPSKTVSHNRLSSDLTVSLRRICTAGGFRRLTALAGLTIREAIRSRVLLGLTLLMILFGAGSLLWPSDLDAERVILVQRRCFGALTFFGLIVAAFLGGSSLRADISSKRVYAIFTKPISRLELLLGKTLGLLGIILIFLLVGGLITVVVTHVASARKTYAGGSYTLEVAVPSAEIQTKDAPVPVTLGQLFTADRKVGDRYEVTVAQRETTVTGTVPAAAVTLHVRSLDLQRVAQPSQTWAVGAGASQVRGNELLLTADELAADDLWNFSVPPSLSLKEESIPVRMGFSRFRHEPPLFNPNERLGRKALVTLEFRNPVSGQAARRDIEFTVLRDAAGPGDDPAGPGSHYEEVFVLPRSVLSNSTLEARVIGSSPSYRETGRVYFGPVKSPAWRFRGFNAALLPAGQQTIRARFFAHYTKGYDLVDTAEVTALIRNTATGESLSIPVRLRDRTDTNIRFPRKYVDAREGVELAFANLGDAHRIGYSVKDTPVLLVLDPDFFWASTARSLFLIFLNLALFTVLAVAASTFLSAFVAIFLVLVVALAGLVKDLTLATLAAGSGDLAAPSNPFTIAAQGLATLQEAVGLWIKYILTQLLLTAPGFQRYSSAHYVNHGWSVPWFVVSEAAVIALAYTLVFFSLGYLLFRARELE